jgi:hypothetical protein
MVKINKKTNINFNLGNSKVIGKVNKPNMNFNSSRPSNLNIKFNKLNFILGSSTATKPSLNFNLGLNPHNSNVRMPVHQLVCKINGIE